jgi:hypothetical protein
VKYGIEAGPRAEGREPRGRKPEARSQSAPRCSPGVSSHGGRRSGHNPWTEIDFPRVGLRRRRSEVGSPEVWDMGMGDRVEAGNESSDGRRVRSLRWADWDSGLGKTKCSIVKV